MYNLAMEKSKKRFFISVFVQDIFAKPLARTLISINCNPNLITGFGLLMSFIACYFFINDLPIIGSGLFFISLILDSTDGRVARGLNLFSEFGAKLDSFSDKIRSFLVSFVIIFSNTPSIYLAGLIYCYVQILPIYRFFFYDYSEDERDPIQIFWESTPMKDWLDKNNLVGIYNGWERAIVVCIIAPLTPKPLITIFTAILLEQALFFAGLCKKK